MNSQINKKLNKSAYLTFIFLSLLSCRTPSTQSSGNGSPPAPRSATAGQTTAASPKGLDFALPILLTSDEHGWMQEHDKHGHYEGGMANMLAWWRGTYDYKAENFLTLSGGDSWTGPYTSTVLHGAPMVQIMNAMGYDAQTIGNHDFDFGPDSLQKRAAQARYPLLAANLFRVGNQQRPAYAQSHTIVRVADARIGVIGLANIDTPVVTDPRNVASLAFRPYEPALRREVAALRTQNVDEIVVVIHDEVENILPLVPLFRELRIHFVGSGHSHHPTLSIDPGDSDSADDDVILCNPGAYGRGFCHLKLQFKNGHLLSHKEALEKIAGDSAQRPFAPDPEILGIIDSANQQAAESGAELLVNSKQGLPRREASQRLGRVVVDSWLQALPQAKIAITNKGGLRQDIDPGPVTMATLVGVLPFDNYLMIIDIDGKALLRALAHPQTIAAGVRYSYKCRKDGTREIIKATDARGQAIDPQKTYKVVVNEFIYHGGDRYKLREADPSPEETALHWRDPVARYLRDMRKAGKTLDPVDDGRVTVVGPRCD